MFRFEEQRIAARKRLLNRKDLMTFDTVPDFIVNAFFGDSSYKNQLIVCTFGFLNGIEFNGLMTLICWKKVDDSRKRKMESLYRDFEKPEYQRRYYSFSVHYKLVMFLNGNVRKFGQRIIV